MQRIGPRGLIPPARDPGRRRYRIGNITLPHGDSFLTRLQPWPARSGGRARHRYHDVLELDPAGSLLWGRKVNAYIAGLDFDAAGNLALGGAFQVGSHLLPDGGGFLAMLQP